MFLQFSLAGKIAMERYAHLHEATQEPSLTNDDADWTRLDQLARDIARLETLTSWHASERPIFRDAPVRDINVEGGWDVFNDDWGDDISNQYERVFREIRVLTPAARAQRLKVAEGESVPARAACTKKSIKLPDGTLKSYLHGCCLISAGLNSPLSIATKPTGDSWHAFQYPTVV